MGMRHAGPGTGAAVLDTGLSGDVESQEDDRME
jgi:hypothetical protein